MSKKPTVIIEYRYESNQPWREYARTQVQSMVENYKDSARREYEGAKVRERNG
jgi:F0F1-type ATP synthase membrane subunit b/b'